MILTTCCCEDNSIWRYHRIAKHCWSIANQLVGVSFTQLMSYSHRLRRERPHNKNLHGILLLTEQFSMYLTKFLNVFSLTDAVVGFQKLPRGGRHSQLPLILSHEVIKIKKYLNISFIYFHFLAISSFVANTSRILFFILMKSE
jgi:hypothetical protein